LANLFCGHGEHSLFAVLWHGKYALFMHHVMWTWQGMLFCWGATAQSAAKGSVPEIHICNTA